MEIKLTNPYAKEELTARNALLQVIDPELNVNIIDLGLVYGLDFTQPDSLKVRMTLSTPHCPLGDAIQQGVINALEQVFPAREIAVEIVWEPQWNIDCISPEGKQQLGLE